MFKFCPKIPKFQYPVLIFLPPVLALDFPPVASILLLRSSLLASFKHMFHPL